MFSAQQKKLIPWLVLALVLIFWAWPTLTAPKPDASLHQVVLLGNDQVFFGKLHQAHSTPYLTDVYYLDPKAPQYDENGNLLGNAKQFNLIKRGGELHGPTDRMHLSRKNIIYWENVGPESSVAKGIVAEKEQRASTQQPDNQQ